MSLLNTVRYKISLLLRAFNRLRYRLFKVDVGKDVYISWGAYIDTAYPNSIRIGDGTYITRDAKLVAHDHSVYGRLPLKNDNGKGFI